MPNPPVYFPGGGGGMSGSESSGSGTSQQVALWLSGGTLGGSSTGTYNFTTPQWTLGKAAVTPASSSFGLTVGGWLEVRNQSAGGRVVASSDYFMTVNATNGAFAAYDYSSGTHYQSGNISFAAAENHSASAQGCDVWVRVCPNGSTTLSTRLVVKNTGTIVTNGAQSALATTATDGFLTVPTCAGKPTGTPTAFNGNASMVYDTTNDVFWVYSSTESAWLWHGRGVASTKTASYTVTAQDSFLRADMTAGANVTFTLPAASSVPNGWQVTCLALTADGVTRTMTVARAGADTINAGATGVTAAGANSIYKGWSLTSDGVSHWDAQPLTAGTTTALTTP